MIKLLSKICWDSAKQLFAERYTYHASALAFITLLALVPLLSVIVSIVSIFPIFTQLIDLAQNYIMENFIPTSGNIIQFYLQNFIQQATSLPKIGIAFLFVTAAVLIISIEQTLNEIWQAPDSREKYRSWLIYFLLFLVALPLIGLSVFVSANILSFPWFAEITTSLGIKAYLLLFVPVIINIFIFSTLYIAVPRYRIKWCDGFFGGFIAAILFEISKIGFAFYLKKLPQYELIYGVLATIPIFLVWIYMVWVIILYGALVTHALYKSRQTKIT